MAAGGPFGQPIQVKNVSQITASVNYATVGFEFIAATSAGP